jgi:hypothetical protein
VTVGRPNGGRVSRPAADGSSRGRAMTLAGTLEAAESAAPVESLDVVARMLQEHLGAVSVSFLITDFNGSSVVRPGAAGSVDTDEPARRITLQGTPYDDVIRTQRPGVEDKGEGALVRIVAPVTNRGDAIGLLELFLPAAPDAEVMREIGETAHAHRQPVLHRRVPVGPAYRPAEPRCRDPAPAALGFTGVRGGAVRGGWGAGAGRPRRR